MNYKKFILFIFVTIFILVFVAILFKNNKKDNYNILVNDLEVLNMNEFDNNINKLEDNKLNKIKWLKTVGNSLQDEFGNTVQLKGISSHALEWYSDLITYENLSELKNNFNISVFRIAMYTDPNISGYIAKPEETKNRVYSIIDMAVSLDMYVIIDWHILADGNPETYYNESATFFENTSKKYANTPNLIYEICNEPNGNVSWDNNVKPYSEKIIKIIRNNSPKSLILVGSPEWSKDLNSVLNNPLDFTNIAYTFHFYAGSHGINYQNEIKNFINNGLPIFVSECGITDASGNGNIYVDSFNNWVSFLNDNKISFVFWSFSNKNESSSILKETYNVNSENGNLVNNLTQTGIAFKNALKD